MTKYAIYGCGGFGREIAPIAKSCAKRSSPNSDAVENNSIVFVSDSPTEAGTVQNGYRVISFDDFSKNHAGYRIVIAVGDYRIRQQLALKCMASGIEFGSIRAETYRELDDVEIGAGAILCDFSMTTSNIRIGVHFHANIYSYVAHDCVIGDFVTLAPRVCINGNTIIEDGAYIGAGAVIKQGTTDKPIRIGRGAIIGMGSVVTKDVPANAVVLGNPARIRE